jgi:thiopeptide-type bacteriocin biosynthesis protein
MKENVFRVAEFFLLRTPALPVSSLTGLRAEFASGKPIHDCALLKDDYVREALFLASRNLYCRSLEGDAADDGRLGLSLARYVYRMAGRPTPFGLFAGVTTGKIGTNLSLRVGSLEQARRVCRIDLGVISRLQNGLSQPDLSDLPRLRAQEVAKSTSLWEAPDGFRYVEGHCTSELMRYRLARIDANEALRFVVSQLQSPCLFETLAQRLANHFGREIEQAESFLVRMVRDQFLVPLPQIAVTGNDPICEFLEELAELPQADQLGRSYLSAARELGAVGHRPAENIEVYDRVTETLRPAGADETHFQAMQVDLHRIGTTPELPKELVDEIVQQIWTVRRLLFGSGRQVDLSQFADEFTSRFGDASVPLLQALDEDYGIALAKAAPQFGSLLEGFIPRERSSKAEYSMADALLLGLAQQAFVDGAPQILLRDEDLKTLEQEPFKPPSSLGVLGSLHAREGNSLERHEYLFHLHAVGGPSSCNLLARFSSGNPDLARRVRDFLSATESSGEGAIIAELAHLPSGRIGNVLLRPVLRSHEIAYMGKSGAQPGMQIDVSDLYLRCEDNRVILFSRSLGKRILPRITNAHMFLSDDSLPVYKFLGMLQFQDEPVPRSLWGSLDSILRFAPRIQYRNILLSPARWRLDALTTKQIARDVSGDALRNLLEQSPLGPRVRIRDSENFLELDLSEKLDQALFIEECRRSDMLTLEKVEEEELQGDVVDVAGKSLRHELIIPVSLRHPAAGATDVASATLSEAIQEQVPSSAPGGDWLYARVFCGPSIMDDLIVKLFPEIADFAKSLGAQKAFFIRYDERGYHLRLRFQGSPTMMWGPLRERLETLLTPRVESREIHRFEYATYQPEFRRYGGPAALDLCEHLFSLDSGTVSVALAAMLGAEDADRRWKFALAHMARLLRLFGLDAEQSGGLLNPVIGWKMAAFGFGKTDRDRLNDRYRKHRSFIDRIASGSAFPDDELEGILRARDENALAYIAQLKSALDSPRLETALRSLLHMSANRIFRDDANLHELFLYHFLVKSTASLSGRLKFESRMRATQDSTKSGQLD